MMLTHIRVHCINFARSEVLAVFFTHFCSQGKGSSKHLHSSHNPYFQKGARAVIMGTSFFTGMLSLTNRICFGILYLVCCSDSGLPEQNVMVTLLNKHSYFPQPQTRTIVSFLLLPSEMPKISPSVQAKRLSFLVWFLRVEHISPCNAAG